MADYTLYCFARSGNCYKAALMLELSGADWQAEWVDFFNGEHKSPAYLALNEMGEVPLLVDHGEGDLCLSQSGLILMHLAEKLGRFGPSSKAAEREIWRWILYDNHKFTNSISQLRLVGHFQKKPPTSSLMIYLKNRSLAALAVLNNHLKEHQWVADKNPTIADLSLCSYLFWKDEIAIDLDDFPFVNAWLERIAALPGFVPAYELMPSRPGEGRMGNHIVGRNEPRHN